MLQINVSTNYRDVFIHWTIYQGGGAKKWNFKLLWNTNYRDVKLILVRTTRTNYSDGFLGFLIKNSCLIHVANAICELPQLQSEEHYTHRTGLFVILSVNSLWWGGGWWMLGVGVMLFRESCRNCPYIS